VHISPTRKHRLHTFTHLSIVLSASTEAILIMWVVSRLSNSNERASYHSQGANRAVEREVSANHAVQMEYWGISSWCGFFVLLGRPAPSELALGELGLVLTLYLVRPGHLPQAFC
jgi:hypothetical protein